MATGRRAKGEGMVRKRADGRYEARILLGYEDGKRKSKCIYGKTEREVVEKLVKVRREIQQGLPTPDERTTIGEFLAEWLETEVKPNCRVSTYAGYEVNVRVHIVPKLGHIRLVKLTPMDVAKFLREKSGEVRKPRTVQYIHAVLRAALSHAVSLDKVGRNAAAQARGVSVPHKPVTPLTPEQVRAFLDGVQGDRLQGLYVAALSLGLRQGELLGLRWCDVDFEAATVQVRQTLQRGKGNPRFGEPKTERSRRTLILPAIAMSALRAHRVRQHQERLMAGSRWQDMDLVFTTGIGTPLDSRNATRYFQRHLERLGLPRQRFHDARHALASMLLSTGAHPRVVMDVLGHSQIALTMNTYAHVMPAMKQDAANEIDRLLASAQIA